MIHVNRFTDAAVFLERAESWLLRSEAEHNLLLGVAHQLRAAQASDAQTYLATVERGEVVVGCAFRTPPYKFGITSIPPDAVAPLAADVNSLYDALPAVLGPESSARAFALAWSARTGALFEIGMRQRIYQLTRVTPPSTHVPGALRVATMDDVPLVNDWVDAFTAEAMHGPLPGRDITPRIANGEFYIWWDDHTPRCLVGLAARTPNGIRVGPVYTPPDQRGRGYASAAVAALSQQQLDAGARFCFLYTDLSNPTSNSIYQRLGYEPVCDVIDCEFR